MEIHMAHMLEQYGDMASFASLRQPAWHGLGTVIDEPVTTSEMLSLAHLNDWDVRVEELAIPGRSHREYFATVRTNPFDGEADVLGVVGERYKVLQNEELFQFGDNLLDGGTWETAGSIKNGTVVFGSLALDRNINLDPNGRGDKINSYLLVHTSHDGSLAIQASVTPVRVVCQNTLNIAVGERGRGAKQSFRIRHTQTLEGKITAAREALGMANKYLDAFDVMANQMIAKEISDKQFFDIITAVYPKPEENVKGAMTKWETKIDTLNDIYFGETCVNVNGTAWGAYNAMTERLDWYRNPRGGNAESVLAAASGFDAATNANKNSMLATVNKIAFA
jgi:phage/plasmid-like protein (TIGR03299 family)